MYLINKKIFLNDKKIWKRKLINFLKTKLTFDLAFNDYYFFGKNKECYFILRDCNYWTVFISDTYNDEKIDEINNLGIKLI